MGLSVHLPARKIDAAAEQILLRWQRLQRQVVGGKILSLPPQPPLPRQRSPGRVELAAPVLQHAHEQQLHQPPVQRTGDAVQEAAHVQQPLQGKALGPLRQPVVERAPGRQQVRGQAGHVCGAHPLARLGSLPQQQPHRQGEERAAIPLTNMARQRLLRRFVQR